MGPISSRPETVAPVEREIEAAAKAMYERRYNRPTDLAWEACGQRWRQSYLDDARAALLAASRANERLFDPPPIMRATPPVRKRGGM